MSGFLLDANVTVNVAYCDHACWRIAVRLVLLGSAFSGVTLLSLGCCFGLLTVFYIASAYSRWSIGCELVDRGLCTMQSGVH